jgi:hypothetical protein
VGPGTFHGHFIASDGHMAQGTVDPCQDQYSFIDNNLLWVHLTSCVSVLVAPGGVYKY